MADKREVWSGIGPRTYSSLTPRRRRTAGTGRSLDFRTRYGPSSVVSFFPGKPGVVTEATNEHANEQRCWVSPWRCSATVNRGKASEVPGATVATQLPRMEPVTDEHSAMLTL